MNRIAPVEPPFDADTEVLLGKLMPPESTLEPLALFRVLARHLELGSRMHPLASGILNHGRVDPVYRELMIDRTSWLCGAEYEWGVHIEVYAAAVGLTDAQVAATTTDDGTWDDVWDPAQRAVLRLADELHRQNAVSDDLFAELERHFEADQIIELTITAGWYHAIAYVLAVAQLEPESWAARFPAPG